MLEFTSGGREDTYKTAKFVSKVGLCLVRDCARDDDVGGQGRSAVASVRDVSAGRKCGLISLKRRPPE